MEISWLQASAYIMDGLMNPQGTWIKICTLGHIYDVSSTLQTAVGQMWENIWWNIRPMNPLLTNPGLEKLALLCKKLSGRQDSQAKYFDIVLWLDFTEMLWSCGHFLNVHSFLWLLHVKMENRRHTPICTNGIKGKKKSLHSLEREVGQTDCVIAEVMLC